MNEELERIVQNMINAGESEENIALVIRNYVPEKIETILKNIVYYLFFCFPFFEAF